MILFTAVLPIQESIVLEEVRSLSMASFERAQQNLFPASSHFPSSLSFFTGIGPILSAS